MNMSSVKWTPLESNPDVINDLMLSFGVEEDVICSDVFGFDDDSLTMLPQPAYALILCFPEYEKDHFPSMMDIMSPAYDGLAESGAVVPPTVFFMNQKISNACGTFSLIHALANNRNRIHIKDGSFKKWLESAEKLESTERSNSLQENVELAEAHEVCAKAGDTDASDKVDHHFISFVNCNGTLYEFDSSRNLPRACGSTDEKNFLHDAAKVCEKYTSFLEDLSFSALVIARKNYT